jgi:GT2 family glycosyltransferase
VIVVGGESDARRIAVEHDVGWIANIGGVVDASTDMSHLWIVGEGVVPRRDALGSLVDAAIRLDASVAGSKVLDIDDPDRLLSVGLATDVFDSPYTGFDDEERDQGQYDVVRDVAAVSGQSVLLRLDLARGLGGPDRSMAAYAAAVDFCQRARLRGARIIVAPSSEVLAADESPNLDRWRERGGRFRAMTKAYGPMTLVWSLPMAFFSGLLQSLLSLFLGRWRFFDWLKAWAWYLVKLPSTISARRAARRGRVVGDAELFRYQVGGSIALKKVIGELSDRIRQRLPGDDRLSVEAIGNDIRRPSFVVGAAAFVFVLIATRSIWTVGLPAVGFSLPFADSGIDAVSAYAGGWNPAGLGSVEPLRPLIGIAGALQTIVLDNRRLAEFVLTAGSWLLGIWGMVRLLRTWGIAAVAGTLAGVVFVAGTGAQALAQQTGVGMVFALGLIPWVMRFSLAPISGSWLARLGRIAGVTALAGIVAALAPLALLIAPLVLLVWALLNLTDRVAWRAFGVSTAAAVGSVPLLFPWLGAADLGRFMTDGEAYWAIPTATAVVAGVGLLAALLSAPRRLALVGGLGGITAVFGAFLARTSDWDLGREAESAGLALVTLGLALVVGPSFEAITRTDEVGGWRRLVAIVSVAASVFLVAVAAVTMVGGRAGFPGDVYRDAFTFSAARPGDPAMSRILVVGAPGSLPGEHRMVDGAAYRLVSAPMPESWETYLHDARIGDDALSGALEQITSGETKRAGELLATFGVRWIVVIRDGELDPYADAWSAAFVGQLDLVPLGGGLDNTTFENEAELAVRAVTTDGTPWSRAGTGYTSETGTLRNLIVRDNANARWGPGEWQQVDWTNGIRTIRQTVDFDPIGSRRSQAVAASVWLVALGGFAWVGRRFG